MADVLSQGEIDALLSALNSGEVSAEDIRREDANSRVKNYDFKRAMRFSKDHIRTISHIYGQCARLLTTYFSAQLRTSVQLSVESVDQLPYEEFIQSIPAFTILHLLDVKPIGGKFLMVVPPNTIYPMLDRLLGGYGESIAVDRTLTEIELSVLEKLFSRSTIAFTTSWKNVADLQFAYAGLEVNPQFIQVVSQSDVVLVVSLSLSIGNNTGFVSICMPHVVLEPLMGRLSTRFALSSPHVVTDAVNALQTQSLTRHMDKVEVPVKVSLGKTQLPLRELLDLAPGDVIPLNQAVDGGLDVMVGGELKYIGHPGLHRGRFAIKIIDVVEGGAEFE